MVKLHSEINDIHENKFGSIDDIDLYFLNGYDSQSKYNRNRFKSLIEKLCKIAGIEINIF